MSAAASLVRLSGACLGGTLFWQGFVHYLREAHKDGVKQRTVTDRGGNKIKDTFFAGSTDDTISDELKTGDIVFFSRPCSLMLPCGAAACLGTKAAAAAAHVIPYDHCAVVVLRNDGTPDLLEATWDQGAVLRPYDERIMRSLADTIVIRPVHLPSNRAPRATVDEKARTFAAHWTGRGTAREQLRSFHGSWRRFHQLFERYRAQGFVIRDKTTAEDTLCPLHPSAMLVARFYQDVLDVLPRTDKPGYKPCEDFLPGDLLSAKLRQGATRLQEIQIRNR